MKFSLKDPYILCKGTPPHAALTAYDCISTIHGGVSRLQIQRSLNPYADFAYDGLFLNPLEVVFVKVKRFQREANWGSARLADAYSGWMDQEVRLVACFIAGFLGLL